MKKFVPLVLALLTLSSCSTSQTVYQNDTFENQWAIFTFDNTASTLEVVILNLTVTTKNESIQRLDSIICPFNKIETNLLNDLQIQEDNILSVEGSYAFVFNKGMENPATFIEIEDAYIELDLFVVQTGYQQSWAWISNEDVTFLTE